MECNTPAQTAVLNNVLVRNQVLDKTKMVKCEPILIQTVTLTNTNKRDVAPGLVLEMIGYDDLELVSFKVGSSGWAKNSIELREYGDLVVTNEFSIPPGKTVTLNVKYNVRNCPASTDFNFYAQVMIPTGGDACYKYTPMPVGGVGWGLRGGARGTVHLSYLFIFPLPSSDECQLRCVLLRALKATRTWARWSLWLT